MLGSAQPLNDAAFAAAEAAAAAPSTRSASVAKLPLAGTPPAAPAVPARRRPRRRAPAWLQGRGFAWLCGLVSIGSVLLAWHLATHYRLEAYVRFGNIPTPAAVLDKVMELNQSPKFVTNIGISLRRILLGFAAATLLGVALGLLIGRYRLVRLLSFPALEVFRPIPAIAWVPMSIMLWPDNEVSIVFITFLGAFFPILLNTMHGVEAIDPVLLRAARSLGAGERSVLAEVVLPGALPHIFTGLAVGMGVAWVSLIAAEMISGQFGIGYFTWEAYSLISYAEIALGMITIGVLGLLCSGAIRLLARAAMPWQAHAATGGRR
ncbi:ABC transporter permease [Aquabacterium sp.]|uniref:ABC transporter permease n=1 Tax=Aquabacterium sp. TaxID=1872578 RepID=UPI0037837572